jgi:hypothetical protein
LDPEHAISRHQQSGPAIDGMGPSSVRRQQAQFRTSGGAAGLGKRRHRQLRPDGISAEHVFTIPARAIHSIAESTGANFSIPFGAADDLDGREGFA